MSDAGSRLHERKSGSSPQKSPDQPTAWTLPVLGIQVPAEVFRLVRFATSGLVSTVVYFLLLSTLIALTQIRADFASVAAYLSAIILSYLMQSRYTFRTKEDTLYRIGTFVAVSAVGLAISYFAMAEFSIVLGYSPILVGALICILIPAMNYLLFKHLIFR